MAGARSDPRPQAADGDEVDASQRWDTPVVPGPAPRRSPIKVSGGGEGAFDVVITGGTPKAVRFWIGNEGGEGSVKAKAAEETPDNWHTHA